MLARVQSVCCSEQSQPNKQWLQVGRVILKHIKGKGLLYCRAFHPSPAAPAGTVFIKLAGLCGTYVPAYLPTRYYKQHKDGQDGWECMCYVH